jgi:TolB-like protein/DNA-binding winged helix-turn-helix (wHTH) protein/tetratricopeptide (TPR) repeat protein
VVSFGRFQLDSRAGILRKDGKTVRVQAKPLRILELLLRHPGEVVTRQELCAKLWPPDVFVEFDHNLNSAMNKLREALGDSAGSPRFIETLPRGYRFMGVATVVDSVVQPAASGPPTVASDSRPSLAAPPLTTVRSTRSPDQRRNWLRGTKAIAVVAALIFAGFVSFETVGPRLRSSPETTGIAVLPFENLSGDASQEFFSDGFTEEMISQLGKLEPSRLRVIARTSTMRYKGSSKRIDQIGAELDVDYVLEGSVRRADSLVRIAAQLVRVRDQAQVWARLYDRDVSDILSLQADVARAIADEVEVVVGPKTARRAAARSEVSPAVHEAYLKGRYFLDKSPAGLNESVEYFQEAIRLDPTYAAAYAGLSDAYGQLGWFSGELPPVAAYPKTLAAASKALELDDSLAAAHVALARVRWKYEWNWPAAEEEFRRAIALDPSSATAHESYFDYLSATGRNAEAFAELSRAASLDPVSLTINYDFALHFDRTGAYDAAIARVKKAIDLDPTSAFTHHLLGEMYGERKMFADARRELERAVQLSGETPHFIAALGFVEATSGDRDGAVRALVRLKALGEQRYVSHDDFALIFTSLGSRKEALDALDSAYRERDPWLSLCLVQVGFDSLRSDPRFQELIARIGLSKTPPVGGRRSAAQIRP